MSQRSVEALDQSELQAVKPAGHHVRRGEGAVAASNGEVVKEASRTATNCPARNTHETTYLFPTLSKERGVPEDRTALGFTKGFSELEEQDPEQLRRYQGRPEREASMKTLLTAEPDVTPATVSPIYSEEGLDRIGHFVEKP
jgi:hypothetical protein